MHYFWMGLQGCRASGTRILYPFRPISAFWVEIHERRHQESLPFSADFRYLGRDLQPAASGFSTFSADFRLLGRDFQPAAPGFSTIFAYFPQFG